MRCHENRGRVMVSANPVASRLGRTRSWRGSGTSLGIIAAAAVTSCAHAQCGNCLDVTYAATEGLPVASCWSTNISGSGGTAQVIGNTVTITASGVYHGYSTPRPSFLWSEGHTMEARLRVPVGGTTSLPGLRAAAMIGAVDAIGRINYIAIWSTGVALSTDQNVQAGPGLSTLPFDAATAAHTYTLVSDAAGVTLLIDGAPRMSVPYTNTTPFTNSFQWGSDTRTTGPATTEWEYVRLSSIHDPTGVMICPSGSAGFSVSAAGTSPFTYQWRKDGTPIDTVDHPSAATNTLQLSSVTIADEGLYDCMVSNMCGSVISSAAPLTICVADTDDGSGSGICDGGVTVDDLLYYLAQFNTGSLAADVDNGSSTGIPDGGITIDDLLYFLTRYNAGC